MNGGGHPGKVEADAPRTAVFTLHAEIMHLAGELFNRKLYHARQTNSDRFPAALLRILPKP